MNKLYTLALFFIVFPYLGFPYIFPSDIQPLAILFCLPFLRIPHGNAKIVFVILLFFSFTSFILGLSYSLNITDSYSLMEFSRDLFPFFAPPFYFSAGITLLENSRIHNSFTTVVKWFLSIYFLGMIFNIIGLTPIINLFVQRSIFVSVGARGFTSFFPEPSRISEQVLFIVFLAIFLRVSFRRFVPLLLFSVTVLAGSGQTIIVYMQLIFSLIISYSFAFARNIFSQLRTLKLQARLLFVSLICSLGFSLFVFTNSRTRGFSFIYQLFIIGPSVIAADIGVQIKMSGLIYTITSLFEASPFWYYPRLSLQSRPEFLNYYSYIFSLFGVQNPPLIPSIYSSFGQFPICYGLVGIVALFVILPLSYISGKNNCHKKDYRRFHFLYIIMILFAFIKVAPSNPAAWIMLSSFFVRPSAITHSFD